MRGTIKLAWMFNALRMAKMVQQHRIMCCWWLLRRFIFRLKRLYITFSSINSKSFTKMYVKFSSRKEIEELKWISCSWYFIYVLRSHVTFDFIFIYILCLIWRNFALILSAVINEIGVLRRVHIAWNAMWISCLGSSLTMYRLFPNSGTTITNV